METQCIEMTPADILDARCFFGCRGDRVEIMPNQDPQRGEILIQDPPCQTSTPEPSPT